MILLILSFIAGVLTVLAPCILPLLPVIVGGSIGVTGETASKRKALVIVGSLGLSVILFTLLLKASTALISVPPAFWTWMSGGIVLLLGVLLLFPRLWESVPFIARLSADSNRLVGAGYQRHSFLGDVLIGAALGPVFTTCSPTYFIVLATVLPQNFVLGLVYLFAYTIGLCMTLLLVGIVGQKLADKLGVVADPNSAFKRILGAIFVLVGLVIITGLDKQIQTRLLDAGIFDVTKIEQSLLELRNEMNAKEAPLQCKDGSCLGPTASTSVSSADDESEPGIMARAEYARKAMSYPQAPELVKVGGYINTGDVPITLAQYEGDKVVLIDIWTYSCINCQRTLPYLKQWYEKYKDQGLEIVGVHTPEFAFEKVRGNVENAMRGFGVTWPVVLDNDYGTWNAFENNYWPRKYLIDIDGFVVYDHAGEGSYDETERAIQAALAERAKRLGAAMPESGVSGTPEGAVTDIQAGSPEIYFGFGRNEYFGSGTPGQGGTQTFKLPDTPVPNTLYFGGTWNIMQEYSESVANSQFEFNYLSKAVYFVGGTADAKPMEIEVQLDGKPLEKSLAGKDIIFKDGKSYVSVSGNRLYKIVEDGARASHVLRFIVPSAGLQAYTFTFG